MTEATWFTMIFFLFVLHQCNENDIEESTDQIIEILEKDVDYTLNLNSDTTHCEYFIEVSNGKELFIIHPDSLEEFIEQDNL